MVTENQELPQAPEVVEGAPAEPQAPRTYTEEEFKKMQSAKDEQVAKETKLAKEKSDLFEKNLQMAQAQTAEMQRKLDEQTERGFQQRMASLDPEEVAKVTQERQQHWDGRQKEETRQQVGAALFTAAMALKQAGLKEAALKLGVDIKEFEDIAKDVNAGPAAVQIRIKELENKKLQAEIASLKHPSQQFDSGVSTGGEGDDKILNPAYHIGKGLAELDKKRRK